MTSTGSDAELPLLATKLHVPRHRLDLVRRDRLIAQLDAGITARLTLITAPAGFGKSTLLSEWIEQAHSTRPVAWLSLDDRDSTPRVFWRYVLAAVNTAVPGIADAAQTMLATADATIEAVLVTLINDLDANSTGLVLVLDDFQVIEDPDIHAGILLLIERLPSQIRLVIASRSDPPLPLGRMRARAELSELRAADLRFTDAEASAYLNGTMQLSLHEAQIAALGERTEGWIAALQLAALSVQGRADASEFIAGFAGDDRFIVDYLVEEVLQRQPEEVRTFLLQTSILSRMNAGLADAVTHSTGGSAALESLERSNLFLVPLDDHRRWYRYHHLFGQMLRARLVDEMPDQLDVLNRRASDWYAQNGDMEDAIAHAIDAHAFDRAADLIEAVTAAMRRDRQESTLVAWLERLPRQTVRLRPALLVELAGARLSLGRVDEVEQLLAEAESTIGGTSQAIDSMRGSIALFRAAQALASGDVDAAAADAAAALGLAADDDDLAQGSASGLLGLTQWSRGDLTAAATSWAVGVDRLTRAGHLSDVLGGSIAVAEIQIAEGRLGDALDTYQRALGLAASHQAPLRGTADMHVGIADILRERGDLPAARSHLVAAAQLGEHAGLPQNRHRRQVALARLLLAEGDLEGAIARLDEAQRVYTPDFFPDVRPIPAQRARVNVAAGRYRDALEWARRSGVTIEERLSYLREFEHLTLARTLVAGSARLDAADDAIVLLERLLRAAEQGARIGSVIQIRVVLSLALQSAGRPGDAGEILQQAVTLAEPEGYVRVFADEGQSISRLLTALAKRGPVAAYVRHLAEATTTTTTSGSSASPQRRLASPLSDRELDVLRLLRSDLGGADIARELSISLNTVRTHTKSVYLKLGVTSRRAAVRRATELGLLSS